VVLHDRLGDLLERGRSPHHQPAVLFIDLDSFKAINDVYGHAFGDQLLTQIAARLSEVVRDGDLLVRFGGDEFVIVADQVEDSAHAEAIADRIAFALAHPFSVQAHTIALTASIGIALAELRSCSPEELLRQADTAMYQAKARGRSCHVVYQREMGRTRDRYTQLWERVEHAWERNELYLVYQPIYGIASGEIEGAEALLRWDDPEEGVVSPAEFIPVLEQSGRIVEVGAWVLREASRQTQCWTASYPATPFRINVNVSGVQVKEADFPEMVKLTLRETGLHPSMLCLEITEVMLLHDLAAVWDSLRPLVAEGVKVALDDFGTGYSSLSHLRNFALDHLKIDRSFVSGIGTSPEDTEIVAAVVSMARALGIATVAEGVETPAQLRTLTNMGCQQAQGFLWSKPRLPEGIDALLEAQSLERVTTS
jgi:diguanylate cyclase (GGDEF)-like protein